MYLLSAAILQLKHVHPCREWKLKLAEDIVLASHRSEMKRAVRFVRQG